MVTCRVLRTLCLPRIRLWNVVQLFVLWKSFATAQWRYPDEGWATMTHYDMPKGYIASCGCTGKSTYYPTAALSQWAFGSDTAYGPSCGRCMNLTLLSTIYSEPIFYPKPTKSIVVKITDMCPGPGLCGATEGDPNSVGAYLNFDLAYPSTSIPNGWYPSNVTEYGYTDFGVWNISYQSVDCSYWAGWRDKAALGSIAEGNGESVCCPAQVNSTYVCPSFSDDPNVSPPSTVTSGDRSGLYFGNSWTSMICLATLVCTVGLQ